jgi:type II secretory pathway pseudopilin PulG
MPPAPDYWQVVEAVFASIVDLDPAERLAALDAQCGGRAAIRDEVTSLLDAHDRAASFLSVGREASGSAAADEARPDPVLGGWRLLERIGAGGMSDVHRAVRADGDFTHQVAVKIVHASAFRSDMARRVRAERQILGGLHHPHIVTLIDAGSAASGEAFLVMELVDGVPITHYARERRSSLEQRLRLFGQVCAAVQYAHQHGVVHRDLKPANILVTPDGLAKVLDFGVATLLAPSEPAPGEAGRAAPTTPLTPNYASPEQLRGLPVTTVSDVYALGVLLYELVAGTRPYETAGQPLERVVALVLDSPPRRPSAAAAVTAPELPYPAKRLRGDLDAIVLRAMATEPERRYGSAGELAADLTRVLDGRPVVAREPSAGYLVRRFAARHKGAVFASGVAVVGVVAALTVAVWQARVAERQRERAERHAADVRQLANALVLKIHRAIVGIPGATEARQLVADEARQYLERLAADAGSNPSVAVDLARAYRQLGSVQGAPAIGNLGDPEAANATFGRGIALLAPLARQPEPPAGVLEELASLWSHRSFALVAILGRRAEAEAAARNGLAVATRLVDGRPTDSTALAIAADAHYQLAIALAASPHAEAHIRATLALRTRRVAEAPADLERAYTVALSEWMLGGYLEGQRRRADARPHHERTRDLFTRYLAAPAQARIGPETRGTALNGQAFALFHLGDLGGAAAAYRACIATRLALADRDRANALIGPVTAATRASLARVYEALGRPADARREVAAAVTIFDRATMPASLLGGVAEARLRRARLLMDHERPTACRSLERALRTYEVLGADGRAQPVDADRQAEARQLARRCPESPGATP